MSMKDTKTLPTPDESNWTGGLVKGAWYQVKTFNANDWMFWVERKLTRAELKPVALMFVGGDIYELDDIDSVREVKPK